jgi:hypothetical protein
VRSVLPWEVAFLLALGTFLASGCAELAGGRFLPEWTFWIIPACYMAADLAEDALIAWTLSAQNLERTFVSMRLATKFKLRLAILSFAQLFFCAGYAALSKLGW